MLGAFGQVFLRRRRLVPPAAAQVYELTEWGRELEPAVLALGRWASLSPTFPAGARMGPDSLVLALKSTFQPDRAKGLRAAYVLWLGEIPYEIRVAGGHFEARQGEADDPDAEIRSNTDTIAGVVFRGEDQRPAIQEGRIGVEGDGEAVEGLFRALT
jgi:hypothetical protein